MNLEKKIKLNEYHKNWYNKLDDDRKNKMRKNSFDRYYLIKGY